MKRLLLLVCALPCLLCAQNAPLKSVLKDKTTIQRMFKSLPASQQSKAVVTYSGADYSLPDSVYTYSDEAKTELIRKTYFSYNDDGLMTEERWININEGDESNASKNEYTYTLKDGKLTVVEIQYWYEDGEWVIAGSKYVNVFKEPDLVNPIELYWYGLEDDEWVEYFKIIAITFDDDNRPIAYEGEGISGSEDGTEEIIKVKWEVSYNKNGLIQGRDWAIEIEGSWIVLIEESWEYNDALLCIKATEVVMGSEKTTTEYKYDEQRNVIHVHYHWISLEDDDYEFINDEYNTNFYPDGTGNEAVLSVQSSVYPNPVSDVLYVTVEGAGEAVITLVSMNGSTVYRQKTSRTVTSIPVQSLAKGYYILTIQAGERTTSNKVIIR